MGRRSSLFHHTCIVVLVVLAGCEQPGHKMRPPQDGVFTASPFSGRWEGSATNSITGGTFMASALISASGEAQFMVESAPLIEVGVLPPLIQEPVNARAQPTFVIDVNICCADSFEGAGAVRFLNVSRNSQAPLTARISEGALVGEFDFNGVHSFKLERSAELPTPLTLEQLAGVYTARALDPVTFAEHDVMTLAVNSNGEVTGSNYRNCFFNGAISVPDPDRNLFRLQMELSNCDTNVAGVGPVDGSYTGLGALMMASHPMDPTPRRTLYHSLVGPVWLGPQGPSE